MTTPPKLPDTDLTPNKKYNGPSYEEIAQIKANNMHPSWFTLYKKPLLLVDGKMQYVWDNEGRRYLDCFGGVVTISVGHCHPKVTQASVDQLNTLVHCTQLYYNDQTALYCKELAERMPKGSGLDTVFLCNSGSEATDFAVHMARMYTKRFDVISVRNGYHGMSSASMGFTGLSGWKHCCPQGMGVHHALCPDKYKGLFKNDANMYIRELEDLILNVCPAASGQRGKIGCFITEAGIQGIGGTVMMADGYNKKATDLVHKYGGLVIADEIQTGFGRMGTHYWGFEAFDYVPDIVCVAKGIGNGLPLAAVITRREIAVKLTETPTFNTFGGNPFVCAAGRAVLRAIDEENIMENAKQRGDEFMTGLLKLKDKHKIIGDVRGKGLMLGIELVLDRETKTPAPTETMKVVEKAKDLGVLIGKGGPYGSVIRLKPPMCLSKNDVIFALEVLDVSFDSLYSE